MLFTFIYINTLWSNTFAHLKIGWSDTKGAMFYTSRCKYQELTRLNRVHIFISTPNVFSKKKRRNWHFLFLYFWRGLYLRDYLENVSADAHIVSVNIVHWCSVVFCPHFVPFCVYKPEGSQTKLCFELRFSIQSWTKLVQDKKEIFVRETGPKNDVMNLADASEKVRVNKKEGKSWNGEELSKYPHPSLPAGAG